MDALFLDEVNEITDKVFSSVSLAFSESIPSPPNTPMKNLRSPCSVTFPLVMYSSVTSGSEPSFLSNLAELFQRTPSTRSYQVALALDLTFSASLDVTMVPGMKNAFSRV